MDPRFAVYNTHINTDVDYFCEHDPQLSAVQNLPFAYQFPLVKQLPTKIPGIYTLSGGRQIGKSTLLKQWMTHLMRDKQVIPSQIFFFTGDIIDDYHPVK